MAKGSEPHRLLLSEATCCRCGKLMQEDEKHIARRGEILPLLDKPWVPVIVCYSCLRKREER